MRADAQRNYDHLLDVAGQVVGEHTLLFASASEHVALSSRVLDRRVFATGAVQAALWTKGRAAGQYGMAAGLGG